MENDLRNHIRDLEESHLKPEVRISKADMDKILADGFTEIGSSGRMIDKADCMSRELSQDDVSMRQFEMQILAPDVVLTTYYLKNRTLNRNTLRSSIWKRIDGRWQLYFHQGTVTSLEIECGHE
ncbi:nuclear transport factor 2 family protein [Pradoshia sp.]